MDWKLMWRRFKLLFWKNMVMRRRNLTVTCLAVLMLPVMNFFIIICCLKAPNRHNILQTSLDSENEDISGVQETPATSNYSPEITPCNWIIPFRAHVGNYSIGFTPNSKTARTIVEGVIEAIESQNCSHRNQLPVFSNASLKAEGFDSIQDMKTTQLRRQIPFHGNWSDERKRRLYVGIAFKGICKQSSTISYRIWHKKQKNRDMIAEREDILFTFGARWKKQIRLASRFSVSKPQEVKSASFQRILDQVLIRFLLSQHSLNQTFDATLNEVSVEPFPLNSTNGNPGKLPTKIMKKVGRVIGSGLPVGIVLPLAIISGVVNEKKSQLKSLLSLMGIPRWMNTLCWFVDGMILGCISSALLVFVYKTPFGDLGFEDATAPFSNSNWAPLFLTLVAYTIHGLSICLFISSFFNTAHLAMIALVVAMISLSHGVTMNMAHFSSFQRSVAVMLLPNCATGLFLTIAFDLEMRGTGLQWSNFCDPVELVDSVTYLQFIALQGGMSVVYVLLAQYMENILLQDSYGVAKPFYYPFLWSTWFSSAKKVINEKRLTADKGWEQRPADNNKWAKYDEFELEPSYIKPGVEILGLTKEFRRGRNEIPQRVVNEFNLNLFQGQITVLLGHNGCGKSSLISMLTGLSKPSDGTAIVNGYNLNSEMEKIHKDLGFCPQKNVLCNELSVVENLLLFGQLKGLSKNQVDQEIRELLHTLGLDEKKNTPAKFLSGGQKRKLQLAISLISDSKVVYLDEPTSGMDPESRRLVWDFLLEMRKKRTILLTTHFMEEAEVCGDRIAIMEAGKLKYCGTSFFLKRLFGTGYTLHLNLNLTQTRNPAEEKEQVSLLQEYILSKVRNYIQYARIKPRFVQNNIELDIILPMIASVSDNENYEHTTVTSQIHLLLQHLNNIQEDLKINKFALFITTMDDIFSSAIGEDHMFAREKGDTDHLYGHPNGDSLKHQLGSLSNSLEKTKENLLVLSPFKLAFRQVHALVKRRIEYNWNQKSLLVVQLTWYFLITVLSGLMVKDKPDELLITEEKEDMKWHDMERFSVVDLNSTAKGVKGFYSAFVKGSAQFTSNCLTNSILQGAVTFISKNLSVNTSPSGVFQSLEDYDMLKRIEITSLDRPQRFLDVASTLTAALFVFRSMFLILPLQEKQTRVKHLEMMTGLSPFLYWSSLFFYDFLLSSLASSMCICILILLEGDISVAKDGGLSALVVMLSLFNFTEIAFAYFITCCFPSPVSGLFTFLMLQMIGVTLTNCINLVDAFVELTSPLSNFIQYGLKLIPAAGFIASLNDFYPTAIINSRCKFVPKFFKSMACDPIYQQHWNQNPGEWTKISDTACCDKMEIKTRPYLEWNVKNSSVVTDLKSYDSFGGFQGLGQELCIVFTVGFLYLMLALAAEYKVYEKLYDLYINFTKRNQPQKMKFTSTSFSQLEEDVKKEQERVLSQIQTNNGDFENYDNIAMKVNIGQQDAFLCVDLCKKFGSFQAVSNLSFGVHPGECFGLLGVNGAGKSTTFSMLTGAIRPSFGDVFIKSKSKTSRILSLLENKHGYLQNIGYCPQVDALLPMLTGRQHLELFARLRGCSSQETKIQVQRWLHNLGLEQNADYECGNYSGGMQRRLNTAISMIANPSMILLDEPTSGVDPVSRRQFWRVVASLKDSGQSVILTSHCMEECENLCSRLGIMVRGQLQCLGNPNSLRDKCPQGYVLKIQLRSPCQEQEQNKSSKAQRVHPSPTLGAQVDQLREVFISEIKNRFHPCTLQEFHQNRLQFSLENKKMGLAEAFKIMEEISVEYSNQIQEFCLGETTLEQIFLAVATSGGLDV